MTHVSEILSFDGFVNFIGENKRAIIFYGSPDCEACTELKNIYERIANRYHKRIAFGYTNIKESELKIQYIPMFVSFYKKEEINKIIGADKHRLKNFIKEAILQK